MNNIVLRGGKTERDRTKKRRKEAKRRKEINIDKKRHEKTKKNK